MVRVAPVGDAAQRFLGRGRVMVFQPRPVAGDLGPGAETRAALAECAGEIAGDGFWFSFGGACPVQGAGDVDGFPADYRARGQRVELAIFAVGADPWAEDPIWHRAWTVTGASDRPCSWLPAAASFGFIMAGVSEWRADPLGLARTIVGPIARRLSPAFMRSP